MYTQTAANIRHNKSNVCVTVHHWYSIINNQLDAKITIYYQFQSTEHVSGDNFAHPQECVYSFWYNAPAGSVIGALYHNL